MDKTIKELANAYALSRMRYSNEYLNVRNAYLIGARTIAEEIIKELEQSFKFMWSEHGSDVEFLIRKMVSDSPDLYPKKVDIKDVEF